MDDETFWKAEEDMEALLSFFGIGERERWVLSLGYLTGHEWGCKKAGKNAETDVLGPIEDCEEVFIEKQIEQLMKNYSFSPSESESYRLGLEVGKGHGMETKSIQAE